MRRSWIPAWRALCLLASLTAAAPPCAQEVEAGLSSQGIYIGPRLDLSPVFALRLPVYLGAATGQADQGGAAFQAHMATQVFGVMADYAPWPGGLRLSAGLAAGGTRAEGIGIGQLSLNGTTYSGDFDVRLTPDTGLDPVLSLGYARRFDNGLSLMGEIGGRIGGYDLSVTANGLTGPADADFDADLARTRQDLGRLSVTPFVSLGVALRF